MDENGRLSLFYDKENVLGNVLQKTPFGFSLINEDFIFEFANEAWLKIVHKPEEQVLGKKIFDIFPETEEYLRSIFENVKNTREPFYAPEHNIKLERKGLIEDVFLNFVYQPIYNESGDLQYFATVVLEVTDLVTTKNKVKNDEERLRLATESSHTATWDLNLKTFEIIHSPYLSKIFGYEDGEQISHETMRNHLSEYDRINIVEKAFEEALKTGIYQYEARQTDKNGIEKWISTNGKIFFGELGEPNRMVGVMQDITQRKTSEILLQQSHHQLNTAMDASKLGRFDMDFETQQKYNFSPRFLAILGYDSGTEQISSKVFEKHIHKNFIKQRTEALKEAKKTGDLFYQTKIILRDGTEKWIEIYGRLLKPIDGCKAYISGTIRDITEHKNYEINIEESEKKYRFLADAMPQIVWIGENDGRLTYFNKATMDYSGKDYNEFLEGDGLLEIVHPDEKKENIRLWARSVRTKKAFFFEHRFRNKDNEYRWFLSRAFPELDDAGNVKKWIGTSTDIDDMKRQETQKNDFIKMANHELKTPVTTIKGYVQLLKKMRGDSEDKFLVNSLNTIENQVNKLNLLIGDLLDISRMEAGKLPLNKKEFSLLGLVTETIEDIKASEQSHEINFELKHPEDIEICADKDRITQVLNNLLTNAIKYSPSSKIVNVEMFVDGEFAVVSVEDFGIGMDHEELHKIFKRFYRVSGDDEETFPGFGIGLFIVKDILERHDGKIKVESKKDEGSKFCFFLPLEKNKKNTV
ncbi:PAS domain-containing sensor histidine kinase [Chryseobacterium sp. MP_3.2]|uniref:PAS domain-containing sensor histidine kinase n=1 Tax=Chryseobacterium sp. MP_3.2 TaxID=3071712 RepID=UPI002DF84883|nr:PAS domain S-box-containing protein [Chryseobacterium sp. MP_3.2]